MEAKRAYPMLIIEFILFKLSDLEINIIELDCALLFIKTLHRAKKLSRIQQSVRA